MRGQRWRPAPVRELDGLVALRAAGLETARPLALCLDRRSGRAALVVEAVPARSSLKELIERGALETLPGALKQDLWRELARIAQIMIAARLFWRGFVAKHLYPETGGGRLRVWLIDCEGVRRTRRGSERERLVPD